ncbi:MAG: NAD-dependent epimerase/dehydratase family protein [Fibrobacter sp.]|nr:NAD-dependent epimerase/dehydratase family protein [Fibrobacter sp.]
MSIKQVILALDLTIPANVERAIQNMDIVYVTIGFAYRSSVWQKLWLPFMESVIQSCIRHNAKLVFLGNIYALGGSAVNHITESTPPQPTSKKGQVRAQVDQLLLSSIESGQLQGIIARAPDFFGGNSGANSIMMSLVLARLRQGQKAQWLCNANKIHSYGFVPELAHGLALLGNTNSAFNQIWNLPTSAEKTTGEDWMPRRGGKISGARLDEAD